MSKDVNMYVGISTRNASSQYRGFYIINVETGVGKTSPTNCKVVAKLSQECGGTAECYVFIEYISICFLKIAFVPCGGWFVLIKLSVIATI